MLKFTARIQSCDSHRPLGSVAGIKKRGEGRSTVAGLLGEENPGNRKCQCSQCTLPCRERERASEEARMVAFMFSDGKINSSIFLILAYKK